MTNDDKCYIIEVKDAVDRIEEMLGISIFYDIPFYPPFTNFVVMRIAVKVDDSYAVDDVMKVMNEKLEPYRFNESFMETLKSTDPWYFADNGLVGRCLEDIMRHKDVMFHSQYRMITTYIRPSLILKEIYDENHLEDICIPFGDSVFGEEPRYRRFYDDKWVFKILEPDNESPIN